MSKWLKDERKLNITLKCIFGLIIFVISIQHILKIYQPTLLDDEYCYWGIAAYFNGKDWSGVTALCKYYSYGYSFILYFIMKLCSDFVLMYRIAIVINGLFLVCSFYLLNSILSKLFKDEKINTITVISFLMTLIPCNIAFATVSLTECLLILLFLITVRILMDINMDTPLWKWFLLGIITMYSYMVHQRMICLLVALIFVFAVMLCRRRINWKQALAFIIAVVVMFILHYFIKADIKANLWLGSQRAAANDYGSIFDSIKSILSSVKSMAVFVIGFSGKIFYFGAATFVIGFAAIAIMINRTFRFVFSKKTEEFDYVYAFIFASFGLMTVVSAIFMQRLERMALLVYGRYSETMFQVIFAIGIIFILKMIKNDIKKMIIMISSCSAVFICIGVVIRLFAKHRHLEWINYISCSQIYKYAKGDYLPIFKMMFIILVTLGAVIAVLCVKKHRNAAYAAISVFCLLMFWQTARIPINTVNIDLQNRRYNTSGIVDVLKAEKYSDRKIYYYLSETEEAESAQYREYVQYWLQDKKLYCITEDEIGKTDDKALYIFSCPEYETLINDSMTQIYTNSMCRVFESR